MTEYSATLLNLSVVLTAAAVIIGVVLAAAVFIDGDDF